MEKIETFSQPILKLRNHFTAILKPKGKKKHKKEDRIPFLKLGDRFHSEEEDFVEEGDFRSPFCSREMGVQRCEVALVCQGVFSQLRNTLRNGGVAAKSKKFRFGFA